ncbi:MAG: NAD-dependent epimerase/dehydratase family protein [Methanolobus sp.]|jgi:nucleoside-diphosphate-sugar epimerase|nr:NAD-dependent epimerase/dehydratase family protein [Methanolobus sp.]
MLVFNSLSGSSILVADGAGFIGSHVVDRLLAMGDEVTVFDDLGLSGNPNFTLEECDD